MSPPERLARSVGTRVHSVHDRLPRDFDLIGFAPSFSTTPPFFFSLGGRRAATTTTTAIAAAVATTTAPNDRADARSLNVRLERTSSSSPVVLRRPLFFEPALRFYFARAPRPPPSHLSAKVSPPCNLNIQTYSLARRNTTRRVSRAVVPRNAATVDVSFRTVLYACLSLARSAYRAGIARALSLFSPRITFPKQRRFNSTGHFFRSVWVDSVGILAM